MKKTVGFIGLGVMGNSMASHILAAGYPVSAYTRTKHKADSLVEKGAEWKSSVKALAQSSDVIITMVGYPKDFEEVYFGSEGIIENAKKGSYLIDMTTSKPSLAKQIETAAKEKGLYALDALRQKRSNLMPIKPFLSVWKANPLSFVLLISAETKSFHI